jgi:hypothetical protein
MATRYDVIWYWVDIGVGGVWHDLPIIKRRTAEAERQSVQASLASLARLGIVAHRGLRSIGAPEGPPTAEDFAALGGS